MGVSVFLLALCLPAVLLLPARHPRGPNVHREFWRQKLHVIATFFRRLGSEATMIAATNHFLPYCGACKLATSVGTAVHKAGQVRRKKMVSLS
uniref:Putative acid sphingomyelinase and phm5 phosphate metabolism protein n=1 Tax=Ixodes scapularis TaxID=6945 RepID=A0A4D5RS85_IXOSC